MAVVAGGMIKVYAIDPDLFSNSEFFWSSDKLQIQQWVCHSHGGYVHNRLWYNLVSHPFNAMLDGTDYPIDSLDLADRYLFLSLITLLFPLWILITSMYILVLNYRYKHE